jgi:hypothetical protein
LRAVALAVILALISGVASAWPTLAVTGVPKGDVLNLRAQPDAKSAKVATLPRAASGISADAVAVKGLDWIRIAKNGKRGWANAKFLSYDIGQRLPVRLVCTGTEPFWSVNSGYGRADADLSFTGKKQTLALDAPVAASGRPDVWLIPAVKGSDFLLVQRATCSDGMSDRSYPYALTTRIGATLLSGCCR